MNIDKTLDNIIKILVSTIICIMLTIGGLFIIPPQYSFALGNGDYTLEFSSSSLSANSQYSDITVCSFDNNRYGNTYILGTENPSLPVFGFRVGYSCYLVLTSPYTNYHSSGYVFTSTGKTGDSSLTFSSTYYDDKFSYNSTYDLYYYQMGGLYNGADTFYVDSSNLNTALAGIREYIDNNSSSGDFLSLPQDSYTSTFDFDTIKTFGAWIYSGYNVYSLYGSYNTVVSPTSQYCYIDNGNNTYSCAVFSSVPLTVYSAFVNGETYTYYVCSQYDVGKYYYVFNQNVDISGLNVQPFDSLESAQSAFSGASSGGGGGSASGVVSAGAMTLNVPAGNVLYVRPRAGSLAKLSVVMPYKSSPYSPYWDRTQSNVYWLSGVSSLPDSNTSFPLSGMSNINWSLDESSVDGYGRGYNGYTNHAPFNSGWFVVYNPLYTLPINKGNDNSLSINPTVTVSMQYATEYYIYDLNEHITSSGGNSSSLTDYETSEHGIYDSSTDTVNTSSTLPNGEPVTGGQQQEVISTDLTFTDYFRIFTETLTEFANSVVNIFTVPISHIAQLISSGSTFMTYIGQFFTWLPEPVYQILVSALVVAVAVGVFKLLL